jgi:hypothetical protein
MDGEDEQESEAQTSSDRIVDPVPGHFSPKQNPNSPQVS